MNDHTEETLRDALRADAGDVADNEAGWFDVVRGAERRRNRRRGLVGGASVTIVAAAAVFGGVLLTSDGDPQLEVIPPQDATTTPATSVPSASPCSVEGIEVGEPPADAASLGTPEATRAVILYAAARCDFATLRSMMADDFQSSGGAVGADGAIAQWQSGENQGGPVLLTLLHTLIDGGGTNEGGATTWRYEDGGVTYEVTIDEAGVWTRFVTADAECTPSEPGDVVSNGSPPDIVLDTAHEITVAAAACDFDALRALMFGDFNLLWDDISGPDAVIERWQQDPSILATIANLLHTGEVLTENEGHYVDVVYIWSDSTGASQYRIGIGDDGRWLFAAAEAQPSCSASAPEDVTFTESPPAVVVDKATAIMDAAAACDFDALRDLMHENFSYSLGASNDADGAIAQWQGDPSVLAILVERLHGGIATSFTSPGPPEITYYEWADPQSEYGYRVGITADGEWVYFVAGD